MFSTTALAHGSKRHVMGTAKAVDADHLVVETVEGEIMTIELDDRTEYADEKDTPSKPSDLRAGDRVVVDLGSESGPTVAERVRFAHPKGEASSP